jgi:hypothetical protein
MEAICSSKTSGSLQTQRRWNFEHSTLPVWVFSSFVFEFPPPLVPLCPIQIQDMDVWARPSLQSRSRESTVSDAPPPTGAWPIDTCVVCISPAERAWTGSTGSWPHSGVRGSSEKCDAVGRVGMLEKCRLSLWPSQWGLWRKYTLLDLGYRTVEVHERCRGYQWRTANSASEPSRRWRKLQ